MKKKNGSLKYYIFGAIFVIIALVLIVLGITLPLINKEANYLGWIGLVLCCLGILLFFYGTYNLKKGNYLKLNKSQDEEEK